MYKLWISIVEAEYGSERKACYGEEESLRRGEAEICDDHSWDEDYGNEAASCCGCDSGEEFYCDCGSGVGSCYGGEENNGEAGHVSLEKIGDALGSGCSLGDEA